ncbi:MAG: hypothetical protein MI861_09365, partial [Pirellulales bacterium]|nr:hypothetical protein [Pirellulales bacterium]
TQDGGLSWQLAPSGVSCRLEDVAWMSDRAVIAVGGAYDRITGISRGVVLWSDDAGAHWHRGADEELPYLRTIRRDPPSKTWIASGDLSPVSLSNQFESNDGGRSWQGNGRIRRPRQRPAKAADLRAWAEGTGISTTIRDACRVGQTDLWAVGDHGVILHSGDAGRSWTTKRGEGRQTAVLMVASSGRSAGWPLIGNEALEHRNRVSLLIASNDLSQQRRDLLAQASMMLAAGGTDALSGIEPLAQQAEHWLQIHRPLVLVLDQQLAASTRDAFSQAAIAAGVQRIVSYGFEARSDTMIHRGALLPKRGVMAGDLWKDALLLTDCDQSPPTSLAIRGLYDASGSRRKGDSVTTGLAISTGQRMSVALENAPRRQLQLVRARMSQPKRIAKLIESKPTPNEFSKSLKALLDQTPKEDRLRLVWSVLQNTMPRHAYEGGASNADLQVAILAEIAERFADSSVGKWAELRAHATQHSLEWKRLRKSISGAIAARQASASKSNVAPVSPFQVEPSGVRQVSALSPVVVPKQQVFELTPTQKSESPVDLAWEFHPLVLIARDASRKRGDENDLQSTDAGSANLKRWSEVMGRDPWSDLLRSAGPRTVVARPARVPPRLDGDLSDPCWESTLSTVGRPTNVQVAYDNDFVYLATRSPAKHFGAASDGQPPQPTIRDHDLSQVDRLQIEIDLDSDLLTAMQLEVSESGRTHDAIDGNTAWQPTWYVAVRRDGEHLYIEIAILRHDLIDLPIHSGQSMFLSTKLIPAGEKTVWKAMPDPKHWFRIHFQ